MTDTTNERDWQGNVVPKPASPSEIVTVWNVTPHIMDDSYTHFVVRSWQDMLAGVRHGIEPWLEGFDEKELREGVTITFKLVDIQAEDIPSD